MSKLLLVDGNSIINRAFFAVIGRAPMTAPDGTPTGAVNGFFNTLLSVRDEYNPDKICVLFDLKAPTFRHKMYSDYKAQRKGMMPELAAQMPVTKEILDLMGISRMELEGYEADDLIGTLSLLAKNNGDEVFILSGDHDDFQLIDDKVKVILPQSKKGLPPRVLFDRNMFEETYGVKPELFVNVKALMGDTSDNIKGIKGLGEKTFFECFPKTKLGEMTTEDIIKEAQYLNEQRIKLKKKPLKVFENIVNKITDGVQGKDIYEINKKIIDLSEPLLTDEAKENMIILMESPLSKDDRTFENLYNIVQEKKIMDLIESDKFGNFFSSFAKLIDFEKKYEEC